MERAAHLIELRDVTKVYKTGDVEVRALAGVSLVIEAGEFVAVMGPSGSGKSTLMNILGCLDRPTAGTYVLAGREVSRMSRAELAEVRNLVLGFVFQSFNLLARTSALENVELPLVYRGVSTREREARAKSALDKVGLGSRLDHTPAQLSGGQQQRVAIARAIVADPVVVFADEPTGNLDRNAAKMTMELLRRLVDEFGKTFVMVTHDPVAAKAADRVVHLDKGQIVTEASHA